MPNQQFICTSIKLKARQKPWFSWSNWTADSNGDNTVFLWPQFLYRFHQQVVSMIKRLQNIKIIYVQPNENLLVASLKQIIQLNYMSINNRNYKEIKKGHAYNHNYNGTITKCSTQLHSKFNFPHQHQAQLIMHHPQILKFQKIQPSQN